MFSLVSDTHAAVWYLQDDPKLSRKSASATDAAIRAGDPIYVPTICLVELTYLVEKGRVEASALERLKKALLIETFGFKLALLDFNVADALRRIPRQEVPDMPDRIIAATALALNMPLISRDRKIQASAVETIW